MKLIFLLINIIVYIGLSNQFETETTREEQISDEASSLGTTFALLALNNLDSVLSDETLVSEVAIETTFLDNQDPEVRNSSAPIEAQTTSFVGIQKTDSNAQNDQELQVAATQVFQLEEMITEINRESKTSLPQEEVKLIKLNEETTAFVELEEIMSTTASSKTTLLFETTIETEVEKPILTTTVPTTTVPATTIPTTTTTTTITITTTTTTTVMPTTIPTTTATTKTTVPKFILVQPGNKTLKVINEEIHSMANCPDVDCEFGYKTDLYGKTLCACYNPCWETKCGFKICIIKRIEDKFKGLCHDPKKIERPLKCHMPLARGTCRNYSSRFYYNSLTQTCTHFVFRGCKGNENNFDTYDKCHLACNTCSLPPSTGPCRGNIIRYYYDQISQSCIPFSYGGCQSNGNNFDSKSQCEKSCL